MTLRRGARDEPLTEQAREQVRPEHVGRERELEAFRRLAALGRQHAGVVHEHVHGIVSSEQALGARAHRPAQRHVDELAAHVLVPGLLRQCGVERPRRAPDRARAGAATPRASPSRWRRPARARRSHRSRGRPAQSRDGGSLQCSMRPRRSGPMREKPPITLASSAASTSPASFPRGVMRAPYPRIRKRPRRGEGRKMEKEEGRRVARALLRIAGAGFEPATFGL